MGDHRPDPEGLVAGATGPMPQYPAGSQGPQEAERCCDGPPLAII